MNEKTKRIGWYYFFCCLIFAGVSPARTMERSLLESQNQMHHSGSSPAVMLREVEGPRTLVMPAAVISCDIRNFVSLCEQNHDDLNADKMLKMLRSYYEGIGRISLSYHGRLNTFVGDAVLVVFPGGDEQANRDACTAAVRAAEAIIDFTACFELAPFGISSDDGHLHCGIGIAFGNVAKGELGSCGTIMSTFIGCAVNRASRIQEFNKNPEVISLLSKNIIISQDVHRLLSVELQPHFICLGERNLRGVPRPIALFGLH